MLEMEEEESDSDDEIQKNLAKKREGGSSVGVELWGGDTPRHPVVSRLASTDRLLGPASPASSVNIFLILTIGIFRRNEYIPYGNDLVPYENAFIRRGNELIPTSCWNLHKPKLPKIKTF